MDGQVRKTVAAAHADLWRRSPKPLRLDSENAAAARCRFFLAGGRWGLRPAITSAWFHAGPCAIRGHGSRTLEWFSRRHARQRRGRRRMDQGADPVDEQ